MRVKKAPNEGSWGNGSSAIFNDKKVGDGFFGAGIAMVNTPSPPQLGADVEDTIVGSGFNPEMIDENPIRNGTLTMEEMILIKKQFNSFATILSTVDDPRRGIVEGKPDGEIFNGIVTTNETNNLAANDF